MGIFSDINSITKFKQGHCFDLCVIEHEFPLSGE